MPVAAASQSVPVRVLAQSLFTPTARPTPPAAMLAGAPDSDLTVVQAISGGDYLMASGNGAAASVPAPYVTLRVAANGAYGVNLSTVAHVLVDGQELQLISGTGVLLNMNADVAVGETLAQWSDGASSVSLTTAPETTSADHYRVCWNLAIGTIRRSVCQMHLVADGAFRGLVVEDASRPDGVSRTWAAWN